MENNFENTLEELTNITQHPVFERINIFIFKDHLSFAFKDCKKVLQDALNEDPNFKSNFLSFLQQNDVQEDSLQLLTSKEDKDRKFIQLVFIYFFCAHFSDKFKKIHYF